MGRPKKEVKEQEGVERIIVPGPTIETIRLPLVSTAPLVVHRFSEKAQNMILENQMDPSHKPKKIPKKPEEIFRECLYVSEEGWYGFPSAAFRNAAIRACTLVGIHMTHARMTVFIAADGVDKDSGTPLTQILSDEPEMDTRPVKIARGTTDIRIRPMFRKWKMDLTVQFDTLQLNKQSVVNLMSRAGIQVGIGEGRPSSPSSGGMGWGTFLIKEG